MLKNKGNFLEISLILILQNFYSSMPQCFRIPNIFHTNSPYSTKINRISFTVGDTVLASTTSISLPPQNYATVPYTHRNWYSICYGALNTPSQLDYQKLCFSAISKNIFSFFEIRDAFCEIYEKDVLMDFANDMRSMLSEKNLKKFPEMPLEQAEFFASQMLNRITGQFARKLKNGADLNGDLRTIHHIFEL